jgi:hypothetical protein
MPCRIRPFSASVTCRNRLTSFMWFSRVCRSRSRTLASSASWSVTYWCTPSRLGRILLLSSCSRSFTRFRMPLMNGSVSAEKLEPEVGSDGAGSLFAGFLSPALLVNLPPPCVSSSSSSLSPPIPPRRGIVRRSGRNGFNGAKGVSPVGGVKG